MGASRFKGYQSDRNFAVCINSAKVGNGFLAVGGNTTFHFAFFLATDWLVNPPRFGNFAVAHTKIFFIDLSRKLARRNLVKGDNDKPRRTSIKAVNGSER